MLGDLFREIVAEMNLRPLGEPMWHRFPPPGGVTGVWLLSESHLTIHSFPEFRSIRLNVFCCRERPSAGRFAKESQPGFRRNAGITSRANSSSERVPFVGSMPGSCVLMMKCVQRYSSQKRSSFAAT